MADDRPVGQDHREVPEPAPVPDLPPGRRWPSWSLIAAVLGGTLCTVGVVSLGVVGAVWYFNTRLEAKVERLGDTVNAQKWYFTRLEYKLDSLSEGIRYLEKFAVKR